MGLSRQEYWSGLPFPLPGDLPDPGIQPGSSAQQVDSLPSEPPGKMGTKIYIHVYVYIYTYTYIHGIFKDLTYTNAFAVSIYLNNH